MEVYTFKCTAYGENILSGYIPCPVPRPGTGTTTLEPGLPRNTSSKDADFFNSLIGKQGQVSQGNDVIPLGALALGQNCRHADNFGRGLFHNHLHTLQG